jgi:tRNA modification GTPase
MLSAPRDTIAAIATPAGAGGVGIVRLSGPDAAAILGRLLGRAPESFPDRLLVLGAARDRAGHRLDDVLAVVMRAPRSFTGEEVAELHGHGGVMNMSRLLRAAIDAGARHAEAGEFTRRAFENGKLDLVRAEAILDVIEASSERAWRLAQAQLAGDLGSRITRFRERATALLAEVEACIDFPEEGEEYLGVHEVATRVRELGEELAALAATFGLGRALRHGIDVAIVGPVNAGKSSIFNALLGSERAIVDAAPGTTRDFVEASVVWQGVTVTLVDTAGDREARDPVEQRGIDLGRKRAAQVDLRVHVHSAEHGLPVLRDGAVVGGAAVGSSGPELHVVSKGDLLGGPAGAGWLVTSARTGAGIDELKQAILARACGGVTEAGDGHVVTSERQRTLLEHAANAFERAAVAVTAQAPIEVLALEIRDGTERLAELMGERVGEEVLDDLFRRFCIGK